MIWIGFGRHGHGHSILTMLCLACEPRAMDIGPGLSSYVVCATISTTRECLGTTTDYCGPTKQSAAERGHQEVSCKKNTKVEELDSHTD